MGSAHAEVLGPLVPELSPHALNLPPPRLIRAPLRSARRPALGRVTERVHTYHMLHHGSVSHHDTQTQVLRHIRDARAPRERVVVHARRVAITVAAQLPDQTYLRVAYECAWFLFTGIGKILHTHVVTRIRAASCWCVLARKESCSDGREHHHQLSGDAGDGQQA